MTVGTVPSTFSPIKRPEELFSGEGPSLFKSLIDKTKSFINNRPNLLSQLAQSGQSTAMGHISIARNTLQLTNGDSVPLAGLGPTAITFGADVIISSAFSVQAIARLKRASDLRAGGESYIAGADIARGILQSFSASLLFSSRLVSSVKTIISESDTLVVDAIFETTSRALHLISSSFLILFRTVQGISNGLRFSEVKKLLGKIHKVQSPLGPSLKKVQKVAEYILIKRVHSTPQLAFEKLLKTTKDTQSLKQRLSKAALAMAERVLQEAMKEQNLKASKGEIKMLAKELLSEIDKCKMKEELRQLLKLEKGGSPHEEILSSLSVSELFGLGVEAELRSAKKELKFSASSSSAALKLAKEALGNDLLSRLESSDPYIKASALKEATELVEKLESDLRSNRNITACRIVANSIGIAAAVITSIYTAGVGALVGAFVFLSSSVFSNVLDIATIDRSLRDSSSVGKYDLWLLRIAFVLGMVSLVASIVLISILSWGTVPLVFAVAAGATALMTTGVVYYKTMKKKQRLEAASPTLGYLKKQISKYQNDLPIDTTIRSLIKKLPKNERRKVKVELAQSSGIHEPLERRLSQNDMALDTEHTFAEKFFEKCPDDESVRKAALKIWKKTRSEAMRGLYERLKASPEIGIQTALDFYKTSLTPEERGEFLAGLYHVHAKTLASWHFHKDPILCRDLLTAIEKASTSKNS